MIYVELFWNFLMIGALSFGGGYGMISLVRETVLGRGWLTEGEFLSFIAVSESTPGPLAINMATFIGASQGGFWGALCATVGVVLPSFVIILLVASVLQNLMKYAGVNAVLGGVRPCVVAMILATAVNMALSTLAGFASDKAGIAPDLHCGVPAAVGAACPLPPEKGQSTTAHWDDPALCRTGDPVLGNIRISIVRCLRGILLLMTAFEKCAGRFPINLSAHFAAKKPGTEKFRARLDHSLNWVRCLIMRQQKKQLRWKQPQKKRPQKKQPRWMQPQKKNRSPLQRQKKRSPRTQQQQKQKQPRKRMQQWRKQNRRRQSCQQPEPERQQQHKHS